MDILRTDLIRYGKITSDVKVENHRIRTFISGGLHWFLHEHNGQVIEVKELCEY